jgi:hypothetical protein
MINEEEIAIVVLQKEVRRLRQGLWDCALIAGVDGDGDKTPDHMTYPDIVKFAKDAVQELRNDHERLLDEMKP